jgi:hypothetical protein
MMYIRALYLPSCDLETTFSSYIEQNLTNGNIRRKNRDYVSHNNRGKLLLLLWNELGYLGRYSDGLWARRPGFDSRQGQEIFLYSTLSRPALGSTQPPIQWVLRARSSTVKWPGREADHLHPSGARFKKGGAILSLHPCLHGMVLN